MTPPAPIDTEVLARAYARADAGRWAVERAAFERAVAASYVHACAAGPSIEPERYIEALHAEDLALAVACADGHEGAWDHFVREFRPALYRAADAIDPSGGARELADALYADLYGLTTGGGNRRSLFRHFHGRSRLSTWLRAVLSQRYVDLIRARRRFEPMPEVEVPTESPGLSAPAPEHSRFQQLIEDVLAAALAALAPRDRLRLSLYYIRDLTLAEIGRLLHEHEGSASRHLTRIRREIREAMEARLRDEHRLDEPAIDECFRAAMEDAGALDLGRVLREAGEVGDGRARPASAIAGKKIAPDRSS